MHKLKIIKDTLVDCVEEQLLDLSKVNTQELGAVIDMIKDLQEAIYYCTIVKAMEDKEDEDEKWETTEINSSKMGHSHLSRKIYMEAKEMHKDKASKLHDLEQYVKDLNEDLTDMISDASAEEKQLLEKKMAMMVNKMQQS